jgi:hypothetical protein
MSRFRSIYAPLAAFALFLPAIALPVAAAAQTPIETSSEAQFQIDLKVSDAVLKTYLPAGFTSAVATQGPAKDCNLRILFIDRVTINGMDGKPLGKGSQRVVYLAAPVKDAAGNASQLILGGLTDDPANAPGPFGNYLLATTHDMHRTTTLGASGPVIDTQDWVFTAKSGEHFELHIKYERGNGPVRKGADVRYYSAKSPSTYQISHQEMVLDIMRNTTTNPPDHVKEFSLKMGGGAFAKIVSNTTPVLSWDNILWINRTVSKP